MTTTDVWLWLVFALGFTAGGVVIAVWAMAEVREMRKQVAYLSAQTALSSEWKLKTGEQLVTLSREVGVLQKRATTLEGTVSAEQLGLRALEVKVEALGKTAKPAARAKAVKP